MEDWKKRYDKFEKRFWSKMKGRVYYDNYETVTIKEGWNIEVKRFIEQEIEKARKESEEYGYRRGCIETCDLYFDGSGKEGFLKFWQKKQERELENIKQLN